MAAAKKGNAFATKRGAFAPKRAAPAVVGRCGERKEKRADTPLQHEPAGKVTANCDEQPDLRMSGGQTPPARRAGKGAP